MLMDKSLGKLYIFSVVSTGWQHTRALWFAPTFFGSDGTGPHETDQTSGTSDEGIRKCMYIPHQTNIVLQWLPSQKEHNLQSAIFHGRAVDLRGALKQMA